MSSGKALAIIAGVGSGTGASVAARFAKLYTVVLLARSATTLQSVANSIKSSGGEALAISTDVGNQESVRNAFKVIRETYPGQEVRVGVYNVSGRPKRGPFLEITHQEWEAAFEVPSRGAFNFSQSILPLLLSAAKSADPPSTSPSEPQYHPTLIFTGATASVKASALFANFTPQKFALRSLSQSLAKEFAPQGVHVAHTVIDGVIDIESTKDWPKDAGPEGKLSPDAIADEYWHLHTQPRSVWTWEMDVRPWVERW
ncbi:oxidoreductase [Kalaharituber pfeilii]|nr:oxidoreductase [Kalaharituber pfeilii]